MKIKSIKEFEETTTIDKVIYEDINELKKITYSSKSKMNDNLEEIKTIIDIISYIEKLSVLLDNINKKENNYIEILNNASYKICNLKSKHTNNIYNSMSHEVEIYYVINNLYNKRDNLNNMYFKK